MTRWNARSFRLKSHRVLAKSASIVHKHIRPRIDQKIGSWHGNSILAYWWAGKRNFGDLLTPAILRQCGLTPVLASPQTANLASTGSILDILPGNFSGTILGSGLISGNTTLRFPNARILALRGNETKRCLGLSDPILLGDPGLLSSTLCARVHRKFLLGIVPHYKDLDNPLVWSLAGRFRKDVLVVNVQRSPAAVIKDIDRCHHILSSSLHGIIVADSLGIPNAWTCFSDQVIGNGFKFRDYYSAFDDERESLSVTESSSMDDIIQKTLPPPHQIAERKTSLKNLFLKIAEETRECNCD